MALKEEIRYLKKEVRKEMNHLKDLYVRIDKIEKKQTAKGSGLKDVESELKKKFPGTELDKSLLKVVGAVSEYHNSSPSKDKDLTRKAVAEYYGQ